MGTWRKRILASVLTLGLLGAAGPAASAPSTTGAARHMKQFKMPSGNIACLFDSGQIRCDILSGLKPEPTKPCKFFWKGVNLQADGKATFLCIIDTVYNPDASKLAYGSTWRRDGIACKSSVYGLRCHNGNGHGFFLSRERSRKW